MYQSFIILLGIATLFTLINIRFLKLPLTIGLMILGMLLSVILLVVKYTFPELFIGIPDIVDDIDFEKFLMNGILSFLLFAGAIHIDIKELKKERASVYTFAMLGTFISTFIIGYLLFFVFGLLGLNMPLLYCLLFGALISPTDPIAVLGIFNSYKVRKDISIKIEGESLFNDGIGIVLFLTFLNLIDGNSNGFSFSETSILFLQQIIGGAVFGIITGLLTVQFLKLLKNDTDSSIMTTLLVATGGYSIAIMLGVSGPLTMVFAGLIIGNWIHNHAKPNTQIVINSFWKVIDTIFNSSLFVLMGMAVVLIDPAQINLVAAIITIGVVLVGRFISVAIPYSILDKHIKKFPWFNIKVVTMMTWSGLRGALAFALALSIDNPEHGTFFIFLTYCVVAFSIIVQGLTIPKLVKALKL